MHPAMTQFKTTFISFGIFSIYFQRKTTLLTCVSAICVPNFNLNDQTQDALIL